MLLRQKKPTSLGENILTLPDTTVITIDHSPDYHSPLVVNYTSAHRFGHEENSRGIDMIELVSVERTYGRVQRRGYIV